MPAGMIRHSRRHFLAALAAAALAGTAAGCARPSRSIIVAAGVWLGYEPLFLAKRLGWLDPGLVQLAEVPSNSSSLRALAAGLVQAAALTLDEVLRARSDGLPVRIVLVLDSSAGADMLLARPGITALGDLKGRRIGVEQGTNAALLLAMALRQGGLAAGEVTPVALTIGEHLDAWRNDRVDALVTYEPAAGQLLAAGARRLFDRRQMPDTIVDVLAVRSDLITPEHGDALRHAVTAHFRAAETLRRQPETTAALMAEHLGMPAVQVQAAYGGLVLPDLARNQRLLGGADPLLLQTVRSVGEFMLQAGLLVRPVALQDLVTAEFLPEAQS
jgi:NitT/TauT family transport system substrate-binding protein